MKSIYELIATKRDGDELTPHEIPFLVRDYYRGHDSGLPDVGFLDGGLHPWTFGG